MKKLIAILCLLCMGVTLSGCGEGNGCTICGEEPQHTFQGSKYCTEHYKDALIWTVEHANN